MLKESWSKTLSLEQNREATGLTLGQRSFGDAVKKHQEIVCSIFEEGMKTALGGHDAVVWFSFPAAKGESRSDLVS